MSVPDPRELHSQITSNVGRPGPEHEAVIRMIHDLIDSVLQERMPKLGSVVGMDGGKVKVHLDDEDDPRSVGFTRKKGQRYQNGERVVVMPTQAGDHVVLGSITGGTGKDAENAVDSPDIYDGAVKGNHIAGGAVGTDQLAGGAVKQSNIADGQVTKGKLDSGLANQINSAVTSDQVSKQISNATSDFVKDGSGKQKISRQGDLDDLETSIKNWVQDNFQKQK